MTVAVDHVPIRTNPKTRESRLFPSMWAYVRRNARLDLPHLLDVRAAAGVHDAARSLVGLVALVVWSRFFVAYVRGRRRGPRPVADPRRGAVQRRDACSRALGVIGDLLSGQRIMLQRTFERVRRIELQLGVAPSHYEPGASRPAASADDRRARRPPTGRPRSARRCSCEPASRRDAEGTVTGNTYDKYGSTNPVVRRLMAGFERTLDELFGEGRPAVAARRRLRRGRAHPRVGAALAPTAASSASTSRTRDPGRVGEAPGAQPRVPGHEGREPAVRRRRVRRSRPRSRCSSTCPTPRTRSPRWRAWPRRPPARVGAARAAVARAEHGARRLLQGPRQHARPPQPLVQARVRRAALAPRRRSSRRARRSRGRCCSSGSDAASAREPSAAYGRRRRADPLDRDRRRRASSRSRTSRSRRYVARTTSTTSRSRCCGRCCS